MKKKDLILNIIFFIVIVFILFVYYKLINAKVQYDMSIDFFGK